MKLCKTCVKTFTRKSGYKSHLKTAFHKRSLTKKISPPEALPDASDPNCYCIVCNIVFKSRNIYRQHLKNIHKMDVTPLKRTPEGNISPDPHNVKNYCDSCNWPFPSSKKYHYHLKCVRKILQRPKIPNLNILPDTDDPNFYCRSSQLKYKTRCTYNKHLQFIYKMELKPLRKKTVFNTTISINNTKNPNNASCFICKHRYSSKGNYQKHTMIVHKDGINMLVNRPKTMCNPDINPDPSDPNFNCSSCQRKYANYYCYCQHIRHYRTNVQLEHLSTVTPVMAGMDAGNPNNTSCTICERDFCR